MYSYFKTREITRVAFDSRSKLYSHYHVTNITNGVCKKTIITKTSDNISICNVTIGYNIVDIQVQSSELVKRTVHERNRKAKNGSKIENLNGIDKMFGVTVVLLHFKSNYCRVWSKRYVWRSNGCRTNNMKKKRYV